MTTKDFKKESRRLNKNEVNFLFYDSCLEGKLGVIIRTNTPNYDDNVKRLTECGYSLEGKYLKKKGCEIFTIKIDSLEEILKEIKEEIKEEIV